MKQSIQIQIPKPCHENWEAMTPAVKGRFCQACQKTVFDFTKSSDRQIVDELLKSDSLCGRFTPYQLNRDLVVPTERKKNWFSYLAASAITMFVSIWQTQAQDDNVIQTEQTDTFNNNQLKGDTIVSALPTKLIKGTVLDGDGLQLPGATIEIKGKAILTKTDYDGNFIIEASQEDILVFAYAGFVTKEIEIGKLTETIVMEVDSNETDIEIVVGGIWSYYEPTYKRSIKPKTYKQRRYRAPILRIFSN